MRDPKRIDYVLGALGALWHRYPDMRFGQLIVNLFGYVPRDPWFPEDDEWVQIINDRIERGWRA